MTNYPIVLLAGQSNALGYGNTGPAPYTPTWRVQIWNEDKWAFEFMNPGVNTGGLLHPTAWGPEVGFANRWLADHPNGILWLGKVARGSTPLEADSQLDWSPTVRGEMYDDATEVARHMRSNLGRDRLNAVLWMQGESDATELQSAMNYHRNLTDLITAAKRDWMNDPHGAFVLGRISDSPSLPYNYEVRSAQWLVLQEQHPSVGGSVMSFRTIGFGMQPDGIHYSESGHVALGSAFYDNWLML